MNNPCESALNVRVIFSARLEKRHAVRSCKLIRFSKVYLPRSWAATDEAPRCAGHALWPRLLLLVVVSSSSSPSSSAAGGGRWWAVAPIVAGRASAAACEYVPLRLAKVRRGRTVPATFVWVPIGSRAGGAAHAIVVVARAVGASEASAVVIVTPPPLSPYSFSFSSPLFSSVRGRCALGV